MKTSVFQQVIESVESLPLEDQEILLDILQKRLQERRRTNLHQEVSEIKQEFAKGNVKFSSVDEFLAELDVRTLTNQIIESRQDEIVSGAEASIAEFQAGKLKIQTATEVIQELREYLKNPNTTDV
jgi:TRAP-type C4-dicarboxylate transport system substrate-binding protein